MHYEFYNFMDVPFLADGRPPFSRFLVFVNVVVEVFAIHRLELFRYLES
jgi:hypothetical protein